MVTNKMHTSFIDRLQNIFSGLKQ